MINGYDIGEYFSTTPTKTFSELSNGSSGSLINSSQKAICYDDIVKSFCKKAAIKSVDSIFIKDDVIYFIEFKTGFKQKINKSNFDESKWYCEDKKAICKENMNRFKEYKDLSYNEQKRSLNLKAVESAFFFNGIIVPKCNTCDKHYKMVLIVVVDVSYSPIDALQQMQNDMGNIETDNNNTYKNLNNSFDKLRPSNFDGNALFYDEIFIYSSEEFTQNLLRN